MAARAIASLSLTFGLVSIPVKLYSATESSAAIRFKLMGRGGARLRQQYVVDDDDDGVRAAVGESVAPAVAPAAVDSGRPAAIDAASRLGSKAAPPSRASSASARSASVEAAAADDEAAEGEPVTPAARGAIVERDDLVKGYEFEKGRFVLFTPAELKALQEASRQTIDIVSFIPERAVDPIYYDKAYFLAPDKRGEKTYSLLLAAMRRSGRCALAKWAWRAKQYMVQIRPAEGGMVLQQLLYADEVRSLADLDIKLVDVAEPELKLALQLIEQIAEETYDPTLFVDEEKERILAAVERKIAGQQIVAAEPAAPVGGQVIDLMAALRASLRTEKPKPVPARRAASPANAPPAPARKAARRGAPPAVAPSPRARAKK
jgi:DNA end-binding protein Ku